MATEPLRSDPSGPDTEHSENEAAEELQPVLVLRTAKSLILPLRVPDQWEEHAFASQRTHTLTLSIGPGIDDGSANVFLQSDSIRNEGSWRAYLYRGTEMRAGVPFTDGYVELHRGFPPASTL